VSFVRVAVSGTSFEAAEAGDIGGLNVQLLYVLRERLLDVPQGAFMDGALAGASGGGGAGGSGSVYVTDISVPGGTATSKDWQDPIGQTVLQEVTVSGLTIDVELRTAYPLVTVDAVAGTMTRDVSTGFYSGVVQVTIPDPGAGEYELEVVLFTPDDEEGATDNVIIRRDPPPNITSVLFDGADYPDFVTPLLPGGTPQSALKPGQTRVIDVVADKSFKEVVLTNAGATIGQAIPVTPGLSASVVVTIADRGDVKTAYPAHVQVKDTDTDALSPLALTDATGTVDKVNRVFLNALEPTAGVGVKTYPIGQQAIKDTESATVANTAADYDEAFYEDPTSPDQISIANPNTFESTKDVQGTNQNLYNDSNPNFRVTLYRYENGTTDVASGVVVVADIKPTIDITFNPAVTRLRTGGEDPSFYTAPGSPGPDTSPQDYIVRITSDQPLIEAPTLLPDAGGNRGTFTTPFAMVGGNPEIWEATFRIDESIPDQVGTFSFEGLQAKGLAGLVQDAINSGASYTIGGFVTRARQVPALQDRVSFHGPVTDLAKLVVGNIQQIAQPGLVQPIGTPPTSDDGKENWVTIDALNTSPFQLIMLHIPTIANNILGDNIIEGVEETET
jgi:hypothetical protein